MSKDKDNKADNSFKILTIGESQVGKTSILRRYVDNKYIKHHLSTIGIDYRTKMVKVLDKEVKLKIWDTAGQERYHHITSQMYKGAHGVMLVFDVTDDNSFEKIKDWMEDINSNISKNEISIILIGNKCDLVEERVIDEERAKNLASELDIKYYETSALNGKGIEEAFEGLVKLILKKNKIIPESRTISLVSAKPEDVIEKNGKKKGCC